MSHNLPMRMHGRNQSEPLKSVRSEAGCSLTPNAPITTPGCEVSIPGMKLGALRTLYHHLPLSRKNIVADRLLLLRPLPIVLSEAVYW